MIKKLMFISIVTVALMSCSSTQSTSSGSSTSEKISKEDPDKIPGSTPITQPVDKNTPKLKKMPTAYE